MIEFEQNLPFTPGQMSFEVDHLLYLHGEATASWLGPRLLDPVFFLNVVRSSCTVCGPPKNHTSLFRPKCDLKLDVIESEM
jgi:hypothetical protein